MLPIEKKWKKRGITVLLVEHPTWINFILLEIPGNRRRQGLGTIVINDVNKFGDEQQKMIVLRPSDQFESSLKGLIRLYRGLGYRLVSKRRTAILKLGNMVRYPKKKTKLAFHRKYADK